MSTKHKQRIGVLTTWVRRLPTVQAAAQGSDHRGDETANGTHAAQANSAAQGNGAANGAANGGLAEGDVVADEGQATAGQAAGYVDPAGYTIGQCW